MRRPCKYNFGFGSLFLAVVFDNGSANIDNFSMAALIIGTLLSSLLFIPLMMAIWFAPPLIVLHDLDAISAMKKSFKGVVANLLPMFLYGLLSAILFAIFLVLTVGIGMIIVFPLMMISIYTSYRDVWTDQPLSAV